MPPPTTGDDFCAVAEKSRLVTAAVLDRYRPEGDDPEPPDRVAERMVRDGVLTPFQAGLLLEGKSRPFFVGPYKVLARIGSGSSGVVYLCEHVAMRHKVAVKVLQGRRAKDEVALQRFLREARAAAALNHPNVVRAIDLGREGDVHYLSMEYVDGASLLARVRDGGRVPPRLMGGYLRQAAAGLDHAHAAGLVHRDITPSNVMIGHDGAVKLLDLGLALFAECEENLTQGAPLGLIGYIPPEQERDGHAVDARSDIYALGATAYFGLTGRAPNPRRGPGDTPAPRGAGDTATDFDRLMAIVDRMMARDPDARFQTAAEVIAAVDVWLAPPPPPPRAAEPAVADSTDFVLGPEHDCPMAEAVESPAEPAAPAEPVASAFAFDRAPQPRREPAPRPEPARPAPRPTEEPVGGWGARYWWALVLAALVVGFGASYLVRGPRQTAADAILKAPPRAVSPNSP